MLPTIQLYTFPASQNAVRPEIALREKQLPFEKIAVDLRKGEHRQAPLADVTPRQQVPTLVYQLDGPPIVVYESIATIRFIDDMHPTPPLMPPIDEPERRARALMRIEEFQAKLDPKNVFGSVAFGGMTRADLASRIEALIAELTRWDDYLTGRQFLADDQFTLADIAVFPLLLHFEALGFAYAERTPVLASYIERCKARASVRESGWVEAFYDFVSRLAPAEVLADS